ncbi:GNAT family N-acetyltransferase [Streptomyces liangshanensis]|uniref:GNAT family N-acetyltransferase n=1 Tax=Streptomyces liangshanensis TaxID=2717324 RepID=UPI0036DB319B
MIRPATPADLDAITVVHAEARATYYRGHLPDDEFDGPDERARTRAAWANGLSRDEPGAAVLCAEHDGRPVGVAAYRRVDGVMTLTQLHVAPAHWRRGIGAALHEACVAAWRRDGVGTARLEVFEPNKRAQAFYAAHGWYPDPDTPRDGTHLILRLEVRRTAEPTPRPQE